MNFRFPNPLAAVVAAGIGLVLPVAAPAHEAFEPQLKQVGATAVVYKGPQIEMALSYRYAATNREGQWLLLDSMMTATQAPVEIKRSAISVRTPFGTIVPLATQEEFAGDYATLAPAIGRSNVAREPMNYLLSHRYRRLEFFSQPGARLVFPSVLLDNLHNTFGQLYFKVPGGIARGNYELLIDVSDGQVAIPFVI